MKMIRIKLDKKLLEGIDKAIKNRKYTTRTEFIIEALKSKISKIKKEKAL